jgi:hypothetical protein
MRGAEVVAWCLLTAAMVSGCATAGGATASGPPSCAVIESFAEQLVDTGITYDYEPSSSPVELAEWVDVVVLGKLTGEVQDQPASSDAVDPYVGYEIAVDEILAGDVAGEARTVVVSVPYNPYHADARAYADAVTSGVPVVVFAFAAPHAPGGLTAAVMEGFVTGCDSERPDGWVGRADEWATMTSLDDVAATVRAGTQ